MSLTLLSIMNKSARSEPEEAGCRPAEKFFQLDGGYSAERGFQQNSRRNPDLRSGFFTKNFKKADMPIRIYM